MAQQRFIQRYGPDTRITAVQTLPCCVPGCLKTPSENAHVTSRAAGGVASDIVPMCHDHHMELHSIGKQRFEQVYGLLLDDLALHYSRVLDPALTDAQKITLLRDTLFMCLTSIADTDPALYDEALAVLEKTKH